MGAEFTIEHDSEEKPSVCLGTKYIGGCLCGGGRGKEDARKCIC